MKDLFEFVSAVFGLTVIYIAILTLIGIILRLLDS